MRIFPAGKRPIQQSADPGNDTILADLISVLAGKTELRVLMQFAGGWFFSAMDVPLTIIYPYDPASNVLVDPIVVGREVSDLPQRVKLGVGLHGEAAQTRSTRLIENVQQGSRFGVSVGTKTAFVVPLVHESTLIGVLSLQSEQSEAFPENKRAMLELAATIIAAQAAVARRTANSVQAIARFDRFQALSQRLTERLNTQELLQDIVAAAREMLDTQMSVLFEVRPDDDQLYAVAWAGIDEDTARMLKPRLKEDLKGLVAWARQPARTADLRTDQRTARATQAVVAGMISELAVPVLYRDDLFGTLAVETNIHRDFSDEEMNLLMSLAAQAGVALHNAELFETVQHTNQELEKAIADLVASQEELARAHEAQIKAYEAELEAARTIQESLLPDEAPPILQLQIAARYIPARHVSGDFYQYLPLPDGKFALAVGDVTGKGMPAALLMAVTTTALRDEIVRTPAPAALLDELNQRLLPRMTQTNMNSALMVSVFDPHSQQLEIANGAMVQPYLYDTQRWDFVPVGGYPLGAAQRQSYKARTVAFPPGAILIIISDGVTECQNLNGELFSFDRFESLLGQIPPSSSSERIVEIILNTVYDYIEGQEPQDDVTVVVVKSVAS